MKKPISTATAPQTSGATETSSTDPAAAAAVMKVVQDMRGQLHLRAVLVRVTKDGQEVVNQVANSPCSGVPGLG